MKKISEVEIPIVIKVSIEVNKVSINEEKENTTTENSDESIICSVCGKTNSKYIRKGNPNINTNYCSNCGEKINQNVQ